MSERGVRSSAPERVDGGLRLATLPNLLSILRLALLVPILAFLKQGDAAGDRWAVALLLAAGLSDLLDGALARRRGAISPSGKVVDPIADKVLIVGLVVFLMLERGFPGWLVAAVVVRDVGLVLAALVLFRRDRIVFPANWSGKLTTFALGLLILGYVIRWSASYPVLTAFAALALLASYVSYGRRLVDYARGRLPVYEQPPADGR